MMPDGALVRVKPLNLKQRTAIFPGRHAVARAEAQPEMVDVAETAIVSDGKYFLMLVTRIRQHLPSQCQALLNQLLGECVIAGREKPMKITYRGIVARDVRARPVRNEKNIASDGRIELAFH